MSPIAKGSKLRRDSLPLFQGLREGHQFAEVAAILPKAGNGLAPEPCIGAAMKQPDHVAQDVMGAKSKRYSPLGIGDVGRHDFGSPRRRRRTAEEDAIDVGQHIGRVVGRAAQHGAVEHAAVGIGQGRQRGLSGLQAAVQDEAQLWEAAL